MTDSRKLLAEYVANGSETAFQELVARYVNLVYSTALRRVGGDAHLAEDVTQTVFIGLARKGRQLSDQVMLGGWLHQYTVHAATKAVRSEGRRRWRERQAVEANMLNNDPGTHLKDIAPLLDEAITRLGNADRTVILLRFFEQLDFRAVGAAMGTNEDAARMRVNRALTKLHGLLKRRGVTVSVVALGTALTAEAVTAAPAGLALTASTAALAGATAGTGTALTALKIMTMTKLQAGALGLVVVASAVTTSLVEYQARARLQQADAGPAPGRLADLQAQNERLSNLVAEANGPANPQELERLRAEVRRLRGQTNALADLRQQERQVKAALAALRKDLREPDPNDFKPPPGYLAKEEYCMNLSTALHRFAGNHQGRFPTSFAEAASYIAAETGRQPSFNTDQFELVFHGTNQNQFGHPRRIVLFRERQAWLSADGKWAKIYGMLPGQRWVITSPDGDFAAWEAQHIVPSEALGQ